MLEQFSLVSNSTDKTTGLTVSCCELFDFLWRRLRYHTLIVCNTSNNTGALDRRVSLPMLTLCVIMLGYQLHL